MNIYNESKVEVLKNKRNILQIEKNKLSNKSMDNEQKSIYQFGLGVVTIISAILFYPTLPILVVILPITYVIGVSTVRIIYLIKKEYIITKEIINLDNKIYNIEKTSREKEVIDKDEYVYRKINSSDLGIKKEIDGPRLIKKK